MNFIRTEIPDLIIIEPDVFADDRGYFFESYSQQKFHAGGITATFVQDNESKSQKNVLRGLHFQKGNHAQAKLVRVIQGAVLDVAVDIRPESPFFGKHVSVELTAQNKRMFFIPEGFAHGFLTLENNTVFSYKCNQFYCKEAEGSILWNDPDLAISWGCDEQFMLSEKDLQAPSFKEFLNSL